MAGRSTVGAGLPGRTGPRHQPGTGGGILAPGAEGGAGLPGRDSALQASSETRRSVLWGSKAPERPRLHHRPLHGGEHEGRESVGIGPGRGTVLRIPPKHPYTNTRRHSRRRSVGQRPTHPFGRVPPLEREIPDRKAEGRTPKEFKRSLNRYLLRRTFRLLEGLAHGRLTDRGRPYRPGAPSRSKTVASPNPKVSNRSSCVAASPTTSQIIPLVSR